MITSKIKNYLILILLVLFLLTGFVSYLLLKKVQNQHADFSNLYNNFDALKFENQELRSKTRVYKLTIEDLLHIQDSITMKLMNTKDSLRIKDDKIKSLQYYLEIFSKKDTIIFKDTIFISKLNIDTTIRHPYYTLWLHFEYPNVIVVEPCIINEKEIFVHNEKVTIKPPKKYWIQRLFQRKHLILTVDIVDKNPYMLTEKARYIEVIK